MDSGIVETKLALQSARDNYECKYVFGEERVGKILVRIGLGVYFYHDDDVVAGRRNFDFLGGGQSEGGTI